MHGLAHYYLNYPSCSTVTGHVKLPRRMVVKHSSDVNTDKKNVNKKQQNKLIHRCCSFFWCEIAKKHLSDIIQINKSCVLIALFHIQP